LAASLIAERTGMQTIVLDNQGEFASLREVQRPQAAQRVVEPALVQEGGEIRASDNLFVRASTHPSIARPAARLNRQGFVRSSTDFSGRSFGRVL
jgi:hypothetical protein